MSQKTWGFFSTAVRILNTPVRIWVFYTVSSHEVSGRKFHVIISSTPPACLHCNHSWFNCPTLQWSRCRRMATFTIARARSTWAVYVIVSIYVYACSFSWPATQVEIFACYGTNDDYYFEQIPHESKTYVSHKYVLFLSPSICNKLYAWCLLL